ncbi:hypothetical protein [Streptomyces sp. 891-h]|uniref:hypothetical protein n=1 Tax=Streptomyces sp. 891-h TaxID=2720714 RepID=UPI001FA95BC4|nr:hypothetical protein [Streptomyces sp. 891-h]UNZ22308.1 hypothetical protein HC362_34640 [Streptomyces sp. 891-h]
MMHNSPADRMREYRRGSHLGAARNLVRILADGFPPVLSWEITRNGTLIGELEPDGRSPVEMIRSIHRAYGGTVACQNRVTGRRLVAQFGWRTWSVELWTPSPLPLRTWSVELETPLPGLPD